MNDTTDDVVLYTDGACRGNPGPGGWGAVLEYKKQRLEINGADSATTNNRMELMAAIAGLETLKKPTNVILYTDSTYVKQGITTWIHNWKARNWQTAAKKPVKNVELWQRLDSATAEHAVEWRWVKGHSGDPGNERADALANRAIDGDIVNVKTEIG